MRCLLLFICFSAYVLDAGAQSGVNTPFTVVQFYKNKRQVYRKPEQVKFEILDSAAVLNAYINNYSMLHSSADVHKGPYNNTTCNVVLHIKRKKYVFKNVPVATFANNYSQLLCVYLNRKTPVLAAVRLVDNYYNIEPKVKGLLQ